MKIYFDGTSVKPDLKYIFVFRFAEAYVGLAISAEKNEEGKKLIVVRQSREKNIEKRCIFHWSTQESCSSE